MDEKKLVVFSCLFLILILSLSFVSAGFWDWITGKTTGDFDTHPSDDDGSTGTFTVTPSTIICDVTEFVNKIEGVSGPMWLTTRYKDTGEIIQNFEWSLVIGDAPYVSEPAIHPCSLYVYDYGRLVEETICVDTNADGSWDGIWICPSGAECYVDSDDYGDGNICDESDASYVGTSYVKIVEENETICTDSDGGLNYYVVGKTDGILWGTTEYGTKKDYCITEGVKAGRLAEFFCDENQVASISYECPNGCSDGACVGDLPIVSGCEYLSKEVLQKAREVKKQIEEDGYGKIVYVEGEDLKDDDYFFLSSGDYSHFMKITKMYMASITNSDVEFRDTLTGNWYLIENKDFTYGQNITVNSQSYTVTNKSTNDYSFGTVTIVPAFRTERRSYEDCDISSCTPRYLCQVEPSICPSSGVQIKRCEEVDCGLDSYEEDIICNPGECSGCEFDEKCIPYGFRTQLREDETGGGAVLNMYCDIDGNLKEQKIVDFQGSWATCQNNYECESNVCSSGECIEITSMLQETSRLKNLAIRFFCKIFNPISDDEYNTCVANFLSDWF